VVTYRVFLRGANFLMDVDGKPTRIGFFTTRFVQANNRDGAELLGVDHGRRTPGRWADRVMLWCER
jgi:hypothetical protein